MSESNNSELRDILRYHLDGNDEFWAEGFIRGIVRKHKGSFPAAAIIWHLVRWYGLSRTASKKDDWVIWKSRQDLASIEGLSLKELDKASAWLEKESIITKEQHFKCGKNITHLRISDDWRRLFLTFYDAEHVVATRVKARKAQRRVEANLGASTYEDVKKAEKEGKKAFWKVVKAKLRPIEQYDPEEGILRAANETSEIDDTEIDSTLEDVCNSNSTPPKKKRTMGYF